MSDLFNWIAWGAAAAILIWLLYDFLRVNFTYSEEVLTSSREGVDELFPDHVKGAGDGK